jgi:hypothetical protein
MNPTPSSIGRRLAACLAAYQRKDYESALVHFFPALDKVAKRRRPKDGVGARIRAFLKDEEVLISAIATGNVFKGIMFSGITFEQAIYKFGRTTIAHEGELDSRLEFVDGGVWSVGKVWRLPSSYILGMCVAVITAPECQGEAISTDATVTIFGRQWRLSELFGAQPEVRSHVAGAFQNPNLFS